MNDYNIAVLDIGKTNKKLFVYDSRLQCVNPDEKGINFDQVEHDGLMCDDMPSIYRWMIDSLARAEREFGKIKVISISTHGATLALLGQGDKRMFEGDGGLVFPIISYENDIDGGEERSFYADLGMSSEEMQKKTATARFGLLVNHGKQLHLLKKRFPERFGLVSRIIMFPQYLGYLLTGEYGVEPTYVGCHGYLLDSSGKSYSEVADKLGVTDKLPPLPFKNSWDVLGNVTPDIVKKTGLSPDCMVTMGVHDSNAALVPYFVKDLQNFVVQDSGTWIVTMSPTDEASFSDDELGLEVFFNRSIYGQPVKTTIFRGGAEFDFYASNVLAERAHPEELDAEVLNELINGREAFILPTIERGTGLFPNSVSRIVGLDKVFKSDKHAWCAVDLGLAIQGWTAIRMSAGDDIDSVFIEGNVGRSNPVYRSVISTLMPDSTVSFGDTGGAAYGAAILGKAAAEGCPPDELSEFVSLEHHEVAPLPVNIELLKRYATMFYNLTRE